ncbi:MAG: uroporphyrinogen-III C-methyltransferase [Treponema sp.]|jgi:uroporphyrinogen III methyltransferase/synthase|nr:uroporphyrinogen-III C-methyltransferase [Treponema sp.]
MRVTLVGAGPGDKGLLTLKGAERLQNADVVLYDHLVCTEILAMIPDAAVKIDVGKHAGSHPVPQEMINSLLLEKARQGLDVVRLKGGDPFVFGRGGEELELLALNDIPFEVVPGVSSSIAGAAYAGIPVTHRDCASSLHIITGHAKNNEASDIDYEALVRTKGTLVFMMGVAAIGDICDGCICAGMDGEMPAAIVENATKNSQRKFLGTVKTLPLIARENAVESPALIIIGKVCLFSERYDWFSQKPLFGRRVMVVMVKPGVSKLSDRLRELGASVIELPCAKIVPLTNPGSLLEKTLEHINDYAWLVFTSAVGVNIFFDHLITTGFDIRALSHLKIACVGTETEKEINKRGVKVEYCPTEYNGAALAHGLTALIKNGERVLITRAKDGAIELTHILTDSGIAFDDVPIYEKIRDTEKANAAASLIIENNIDFVAFTSSSGVEGLAESVAHIDFSKIKAVCIGERTADAAKYFGMNVFISAEATIESMIEKIKELS